MNSVDVKYIYLECFIKFVEIYGQNELGNCEVDIAKLGHYCEDMFFHLKHFRLSSIEEIYKNIEQKILDSFPIWEYLKVSDWTKDMLKRNFQDEQINKEKELKEKYICYRDCAYFNRKNTSLGPIERCHYQEEDLSDPVSRFRNKRRFSLTREELFEPLKNCNFYKEKQTTKNE